MTVHYERTDGVATITLTRPDARNALDARTKDALRDTIERAGADSKARAVVLAGHGRTFCAGQDLREHAEAMRTKPVEQIWQTVPDHYIPIARGLATLPKPVVAAINGVAAGAGASLAFACDFRIFASDAGFTTGFSAIGLSCDTGMSWTLPRLVGHARATDLLLRPRTVPAEEALELGLATSVVAPEALGSTAHELAQELATGPTVAYAGIKQALAYSASHDLEQSLEQEGELMRRAGETSDHREAVEAFLDRQRPTFRGE